jgi:UDPglucose 6-dehydrogenase
LSAVPLVFLAVGTPTDPSGKGVDLSFMYQAAESLAACTRLASVVVVIKSTVPVGTAARVLRHLQSVRADVAWQVVSNPEFLREGAAIGDFLHPDRVVLGVQEGDRPTVQAALDALYSFHQAQGVPIVYTSNVSAELIKYAANAFLATKIAFVNELADLCEAAGGDIREVTHGVGLDHRIHPEYLQPGPGYGGSCFPKDTLALTHIAAEYGVEAKVVSATIAANEARKQAMAARVIAACDGHVQGKIIGLLGLTFKANTDDMRDSPSIELIEGLLGAGARVQAYDPEGIEQAKQIFGERVIWCDVLADAVKDAAAVVVVTEWEEFLHCDWHALAGMMAAPVVVDLRNIADATAMQEFGIRYIPVGY